VALEVELALEGVIDRLDRLPDPADRSVARRLAAAVGRTGRSPNPAVARSSDSCPANPLSPIRVSPGRGAGTRRACASSSPATSRSPVSGSARHQAAGIPSGMFQWLASGWPHSPYGWSCMTPPRACKSGHCRRCEAAGLLWRSRPPGERLSCPWPLVCPVVGPYRKRPMPLPLPSPGLTAWPKRQKHWTPGPVSAEFQCSG
jgi:hypothetical protein